MVAPAPPGPSSPDGVAACVPSAPIERGLGVHLGHRGVVAADHVGQRIGRIIARHQQDCVQKLARGVGAARLDPRAGALDVGIGLGADDRRVQIGHLVERREHQQGLDRARRRMGDVHLTLGQHLAGVHVRDDPGGRRTFGGCCTLPTGWMLGSASANGTTNRKIRLRHVAMTVKNLPMGPAA